MRVGILGAGAIGVPFGYMLSNKEKNDVVFLVRGSKVESMKGYMFTLFSYDKKKTVGFEKFDVLPTEPLLDGGPLTNYTFHLIIITLPTDVLLSDVGKGLIIGLANNISEHTQFLCLSPGYQIYEQVFEPAGVSKKKVIFGLPLFLSHEVAKSETLENEKFPEQKNSDFAFHYLMSKSRIVLVNRRPSTFKKTLSGAKTGSIGIGTNMLEGSTAMFLVLNLLLYLQDYPKSLKKKHPSFKVGMKAFSQMTYQHGGSGRMLRWFVGGNMLKLTDSINRKQSKPLTIEFLKYHHGHKVFEQNVQVLEAYVKARQAKAKDASKIEAFVALCRNGSEEHADVALQETV